LATFEPRTTQQMGRNRRAKGNMDEKLIFSLNILYHASQQSVMIFSSMLMNYSGKTGKTNSLFPKLVNDNYKDALTTITLRHELVDVHGLI
jgi:hypothetical protein